jgi:hypothetical protein
MPKNTNTPAPAPAESQNKTDAPSIEVPTGEGSAIDFFKNALFASEETPAAPTLPDPKPAAEAPAVETKEAPATSEPAAEAPKEEPVKSDGDLPEDIAKASEKSKSSFRKLQAKLEAEIAAKKELETKLADAQKEFESAKEISDDHPKLQELREKIAEYENEFSIVKVQSTSAFKEAVTKPAEKIGASLAEIAAKNELPDSTLIDAILSEEDLTEVLSTFSEKDRFTVYKLQDEYSRVKAVRAEMLESANQKLTELQKQEAEAQKNAVSNKKKEIDKASKEAWEYLQESFPIFKKGAGNEDWDKSLEAAEQMAASLDVEALAPNDIAMVKYRTALFSPLVLATSQMLDQITALKEENKKLKAVQPTVSKTSAEAPKKDMKKDAGFVETVLAKAREAGLQ